MADDDKISDGDISVKYYLTREKIWNYFKMKVMGDYHDNYLKKDVVLSADIFEKLLVRAQNFMDLILVIILVLVD